MSNDNPAEMTNADLEKDMDEKNKEGRQGNQENINKSTAAEGTLKTTYEDESSAIGRQTAPNENNEQDIDDLVHRQDAEKHNGNMPDPEEVSNWEDREVDNDKISG